MDHKIDIYESDFNEQDYYNSDKISQQVQKKAEIDEIIACPKKHTDGNYYFAQDTIDFLKFCSDQAPDHTMSLLSDNDIKVRSLHSADIWLPVIWIAQNVVLPLVVSLVANYLYDKLKGREHETSQVDLSIIIGKGKKKKEIHYNGPAEEFAKAFEKIDINKL